MADTIICPGRRRLGRHQWQRFRRRDLLTDRGSIVAAIGYVKFRVRCRHCGCGFVAWLFAPDRLIRIYDGGSHADADVG